MKYLLLTVFLLVSPSCIRAQSNYYYVTAGNGYGLKFWDASNNYKIHMGTGSEYHYGPVTDYSIKNNIDQTTGRGWTWGSDGQTPVAAISNVGDMQIGGNFTTNSIALSATSIPMGLMSEWGGTNPVLNMSINFREASKNTTYRGASFRIDTRTGYPLFNWMIRPAGSSTESYGMVLSENGNLGIGAPYPSTKLAVVGALSADETLVNVTNGTDQDFQVRLSGAGAVTKRTIIGPGASNRFSLSVGVGSSNEHLTIVAGGNVGIGTTNPDQKLTVNGTVHATRVKVETTVPGPDYVFEKDYALPSLEQIKSYIDENKHLPEVPSAKDMEAKGIDVGEMNMLLLKKVEELTLYVIQLEKRNSLLEQRVNIIERNK
jgi:hypothetical protein